MGEKVTNYIYKKKEEKKKKNYLVKIKDKLKILKKYFIFTNKNKMKKTN